MEVPVSVMLLVSLLARDELSFYLKEYELIGLCYVKRKDLRITFLCALVWLKCLFSIYLQLRFISCQEMNFVGFQDSLFDMQKPELFLILGI